jgi:hypothetical protein
MSAALKLVANPREGRDLLPDGTAVLRGEERAVAVAKFRELADKLESGELDGARVQWLSGSGNMETVTRDATSVQFTQFKIEEA